MAGDDDDEDGAIHPDAEEVNRQMRQLAIIRVSEALDNAKKKAQRIRAAVDRLRLEIDALLVLLEDLE